MRETKHSWKDILLTIFGFGIVFIVGGYFGYRVQEVKNLDTVTDLQAQIVTAELKANEKPAPNITSLEVPEIHWADQGGESDCPSTHKYKGKITSTGNVVYSPENKTYRRIRANVCFVSLEYATKEAGFFEKKN